MFKTWKAIGFAFLGVLLAACQTTAYAPKTETPIGWVELKTSQGETIKALFARPEGTGKRPAVIFNHGTGVRQEGYAGAAAKGNDTKDYVRAIVDAGYIALAPIRPFHKTTARYGRRGPEGPVADWENVVEGGVRAVSAARAWLAGRPDVDADKIAVIGFSEGGNVTLWALLEGERFAAAVLMSPATLGSVPRYTLRSAAYDSRLGNLQAPLLITVGESDYPSIKKVVGRALSGRLNRAGVSLRYKNHYPGGHTWFHQVRTDHWKDVVDFLGRHLH